MEPAVQYLVFSKVYRRIDADHRGIIAARRSVLGRSVRGGQFDDPVASHVDPGGFQIEENQENGPGLFQRGRSHTERLRLQRAELASTA